MSEHQHTDAVPDYTLPFLVSFFVLIFIGLFAIWVVWGLIAACAIGWLADRCITLGARTHYTAR